MPNAITWACSPIYQINLQGGYGGGCGESAYAPSGPVMKKKKAIQRKRRRRREEGSPETPSFHGNQIHGKHPKTHRDWRNSAGLLTTATWRRRRRRRRRRRELLGVLGNCPNTPFLYFWVFTGIPPIQKTHLFFSCGNKTLDVSPLRIVLPWRVFPES